MTTTTTPIAQNAADAIMRLIGLDTLVDDYEFDAERGHVYILGDRNAIVIQSSSPFALVKLIDPEGQHSTTAYASSGDLAELLFKVVGDDNGLVDMYQHGQYIASEPIVNVCQKCNGVGCGWCKDMSAAPRYA